LPIFDKTEKVTMFCVFYDENRPVTRGAQGGKPLEKFTGHRVPLRKLFGPLVSQAVYGPG